MGTDGQRVLAAVELEHTQEAPDVQVAERPSRVRRARNRPRSGVKDRGPASSGGPANWTLVMNAWFPALFDRDWTEETTGPQPPLSR
jgi:hypothetical protein